MLSILEDNLKLNSDLNLVASENIIENINIFINLSFGIFHFGKPFRQSLRVHCFKEKKNIKRTCIIEVQIVLYLPSYIAINISINIPINVYFYIP